MPKKVKTAKYNSKKTIHVGFRDKFSGLKSVVEIESCSKISDLRLCIIDKLKSVAKDLGLGKNFV